MAVGSETGRIQLLDLGCRCITSEYQVHGAPVVGLHWLSPTTLLSISASPAADGFRNSLVSLQLPAGETQELFPARSEPAPVVAMRVSPAGRWLVLLLKESPFQVWDLESCSRVVSGMFIPASLAFAWVPAPSPRPFGGAQPSSGVPGAEASALGEADETFLHVTPDGATMSFSIRIVGSQPKVTSYSTPPESEVELGFLFNSIAVGVQWIVRGTAEGTICLSHRYMPKVRHIINPRRGAVRLLRIFSPTDGTASLLFAVFKEGDQALWQLPSCPPWTLPEPRLSFRSQGYLPDARAVAIDFTTGGLPLAACDDGCVRRLDQFVRPIGTGDAHDPPVVSGTRDAAPAAAARVLSPLHSPALLSARERLSLFSALVHTPPGLGPAEATAAAQGVASPPVPLPSPEQMKQLSLAPSLASRCRLACEFLGNENEVRLWMLVEVLIRSASGDDEPPGSEPPGSDSPGSVSSGTQAAEAPAPMADVDAVAAVSETVLPPCFGSLREPWAVCRLARTDA